MLNFLYKKKVTNTEYDNEKHWVTAPSSQLTIKIDLQGKHETFRNFSAKMVINSCTGFTLKSYKTNLQSLRNVGKVNIWKLHNCDR